MYPIEFRDAYRFYWVRLENSCLYGILNIPDKDDIVNRVYMSPSQLNTHHQRRYSPEKYSQDAAKAAERTKAEAYAA